MPSSTSSCLFSVIIAEATCIPMLESVSEIFELDMGWRVCCARVAAANDVGCFCAGAVAAALETSSRAEIHERVLRAVPGAWLRRHHGRRVPHRAVPGRRVRGRGGETAPSSPSTSPPRAPTRTTPPRRSSPWTATSSSIRRRRGPPPRRRRAVVVSVVSSATRETSRRTQIANPSGMTRTRPRGDAPFADARGARRADAADARVGDGRSRHVRSHGRRRRRRVRERRAPERHHTGRRLGRGSERNHGGFRERNRLAVPRAAPRGGRRVHGARALGAPADLASEAAVAVLPTGAIEASVGEDSTEIILGGGGGGEDSVWTPSPPSRPRSVSRRRTTPTRESSR